jgi:hypothetical protein
VLFGGEQTNVNRSVIESTGASPHMDEIRLEGPLGGYPKGDDARGKCFPHPDILPELFDGRGARSEARGTA